MIKLHFYIAEVNIKWCLPLGKQLGNIFKKCVNYVHEGSFEGYLYSKWKVNLNTL